MRKTKYTPKCSNEEEKGLDENFSLLKLDLFGIMVLKNNSSWVCFVLFDLSWLSFIPNFNYLLWLRTMI